MCTTQIILFLYVHVNQRPRGENSAVKQLYETAPYIYICSIKSFEKLVYQYYELLVSILKAEQTKHNLSHYAAMIEVSFPERVLL